MNCFGDYILTYKLYIFIILMDVYYSFVIQTKIPFLVVVTSIFLHKFSFHCYNISITHYSRINYAVFEIIFIKCAFDLVVRRFSKFVGSKYRRASMDFPPVSILLCGGRWAYNLSLMGCLLLQQCGHVLNVFGRAFGHLQISESLDI